MAEVMLQGVEGLVSGQDSRDGGGIIERACKECKPQCYGENADETIILSRCKAAQELRLYREGKRIDALRSVVEKRCKDHYKYRRSKEEGRDLGARALGEWEERGLSLNFSKVWGNEILPKIFRGVEEVNWINIYDRVIEMYNLRVGQRDESLLGVFG